MALYDTHGVPIGPAGLGTTLYEYDYYTGSQIMIMISDMLIDTCVGITFAVQQTKTPVYGYASQYYSFTADGHVLVTGELTIAFKEAGYLLRPISRFANRIENTPVVGLRDGTPAILRTSPEQVMQLYRDAKQLENDPEGRRLLSNLYVELGHLPDQAFEDWAEAFEDYLWLAGDTSTPGTREEFFSKNIPRGEVIDNKTIDSHRRADQYPAVDIWIAYGDTNQSKANHTVKKLLGVEFTGQAQTIEVSGQPQFEQYSFIAKNLV